MTKTMTAEFRQSRNDLYWSLWMRDDGFIRWTGYDDAYWWDNVSKTDHMRTRTGATTGCTYTLDPDTCVVTIESPPLVPTGEPSSATQLQGVSGAIEAPLGAPDVSDEVPGRNPK